VGPSASDSSSDESLVLELSDDDSSEEEGSMSLERFPEVILLPTLAVQNCAALLLSISTPPAVTLVVDEHF
jgi:hypothetical protein